MFKGSKQPSPGEITAELKNWSSGDRDALNKIIPMVYSELRKTAERVISSFPCKRPLQPTIIIHEVYIRLSEETSLHFPTRSHFYSFAGKMIRNILVDHARSQITQKKGGNLTQVALEEIAPIPGKNSLEPAMLLSLDLALNELAGFDLRQSRLVELRFFAGLQIQELAEQFEISAATVHRELKLARHWLARRLESLLPKESV